LEALQREVDTLKANGSPGQSVHSAAAVSSGTGTVKMNGTTSRDCIGWITLRNQAGGTIYLPYWGTITG
jgi:hypothetical protein